jgi:Family of unknown function (DUF6092)
VTERDPRLSVSEAQLYELLAHLVSSAETCTHEPYYYGSFRLIDAASRLIELIAGEVGDEDREWLTEYQRRLDEGKLWMMSDRDAFFRFLNEIAGPLADRLRSRETRDG